jgi:hypothetical protein
LAVSLDNAARLPIPDISDHFSCNATSNQSLLGCRATPGENTP